MRDRVRQAARLLISTGADEGTLMQQMGIGKWTVRKYMASLRKATGAHTKHGAVMTILKDAELLREVMTIK